MGAMVNKSNETGCLIRGERDLPESGGQGLTEEKTGRTEPHAPQTLTWADPEASKILLRELLGLVNYQEEYEMLLADLAELEALCPSSSQSLKGGAAQQMQLAK
jgi:hypothetical protein